MQNHLNEIVSHNQRPSHRKSESICEIRNRLNVSKNNISKNDITNMANITDYSVPNKNNVSKISQSNKEITRLDKSKNTIKRNKSIETKADEVDLIDNYYKSVRRT